MNSKKTCMYCKEEGTHPSWACKNKDESAKQKDSAWRAKQVCYQCKKSGHIKPDCPELADKAFEPQNKKKVKMDDVVCYNCNQKGHFAPACQQPKKTTKTPVVCYNCTELGHYATQCDKPKKVFQVGKLQCHICKSQNHLEAECDLGDKIEAHQNDQETNLLDEFQKKKELFVKLQKETPTNCSRRELMIVMNQASTAEILYDIMNIKNFDPESLTSQLENGTIKCKHTCDANELALFSPNEKQHTLNMLRLTQKKPASNFFYVCRGCDCWFNVHQTTCKKMIEFCCLDCLIDYCEKTKSLSEELDEEKKLLINEENDSTMQDDEVV